MKEKNMINTKKAAIIYWIGSIGQMAIVCTCFFILKISKIIYPQVLNSIFLIIGGMSSALWGIIVSLKFKYKQSLHEIFKEFFNIKKFPYGYLIIICYIILIFGIQIFRGSVNENVCWYTYFLLFLQAIIFGGIEEIGWRYTWQPIIENRYSFEVASVATFVSWSLWHYMYFYITDSLVVIDHMTFLIGLLGSCFILGSIYIISKSLWMCVVYHCLLNVFSQTLQPVGFIMTLVCNAIGIIISILLVNKYTNRTKVI